jgi:hypothetical protein
MLRLRNVIALLGILVGIYLLAPPERKKRWRDRLRELGRALALSLVIYWVYMLARYLYQHR